MSGCNINTPYAFNWNSSFPAANIWSGTNFSQPLWSSSSSTSSSAEKKMTFDEMVAQEKLKIKRKELQKKFKLDEQKAILEDNKKQIEAGKNSDGSCSVTPKQKDLGFWGKTGRWLSNAGTAVLNIGKSLVGIEKDGSWNPKKCLKNVAITAAAVGATFIPVAGPAIGYGLLAAGVVAGGAGIVKGAAKLSKAATDKEIDEAQQEICGGAFIGGASAFGLRGLGNGLRTGTSVSSSVTNASKASVATARSGFFGKMVEKSSNFGRDITVNAFRATSNAIKYDKTLVASNGGGAAGVFKTYGGKFKDSWNDMYSTNKIYENKKMQLENSVNTKLGKVNQEIQRIEALGQTNGRLTTAEQQQYALLKEERYILQQNKNEMNTYFGVKDRSKQEYMRLSGNNAGEKALKRIKNRSASANPNKVQGKDIPEDKLNAFYSRIEKTQKDYSAAMKSLVESKNDYMRTLAKNPDSNKAVLDEYLPVRDVKLSWKPNTWFKNEYQRSIGGKTPTAFWKTFGAVSTSPAFITGVNTDRLTGGVQYSSPILMGQDYTAEETKATLEGLESKINDYVTVQKAIENAKSVEELEAIASSLQKVSEKTTEESKQTVSNETKAKG